MKKLLPKLAAIFFAVALVLLIVAFFTKNLSEDQRWMLRIVLAILSGLAAGCFVGSFEIKQPLLGGAVATATGGFAVWFITLWWFPPPSGNRVFVQLVRNDNGKVDGAFSLEYLRPGLDSVSHEGSAGRITLSDIPSGTKTLSVLGLSHDAVRIEHPKSDGDWAFPIVDGNVTVPVVGRFDPLPEPGEGEIKEMLHKAGISELDVIAIDVPHKTSATLLIKNQAGRDYAVYLYDCWWCFKTSDSKDFSLPQKWLDAIRISDSVPEAQFAGFDRLKSTSGYFALFIEFVDGGVRHRQPIGIYNLFNTAEQTLTIGVNQDSNNPFTITPQPRKASK